MTPSLRELQQAFAAAVLHDATAVLTHVRNGRFPAAQHVQIYRNNAFANLTDALAACYPVVRRLVGENYFDFATDGYVRQHPPHSGNLHDFGAAFPRYLAALSSTESLPYIGDVARLEWAWQRAYHAADATPLSTDALATVGVENYANLVFHLHPSAQLLDSPYPCLRIWQVNQPDYQGDLTVTLDEGAQPLLVIRRGTDVEIESLDNGDYALLQAFAADQTLGDATEIATLANPSFNLGTALNRHIVAGNVTNFSI